MKSYCRNSCLNVHYGRWLTRHCISDNWLLIHYLYQMLLHFATSSFPDFSRALLLDDLHSSISFLLIATPSLLSPWSCEDQFYFSGLLFYLLQKACPCHNTSIFLEALVNSSSVFFFFTCNSSKLQMSDSAGTDALGTNPVRQRTHCFVLSLSNAKGGRGEVNPGFWPTPFQHLFSILGILKREVYVPI